MMQIKISAESLESLSYSPATEEDEIGQCVTALAMTRQGNIPLERGMGLPMKYLHRNMPAAQAVFEAELLEQMDIWEPEAVLTAAGYSFDANGEMIPVLEVKKL